MLLQEEEKTKRDAKKEVGPRGSDHSKLLFLGLEHIDCDMYSTRSGPRTPRRWSTVKDHSMLYASAQQFPCVLLHTVRTCRQACIAFRSSLPSYRPSSVCYTVRNVPLRYIIFARW